MWVGRFSLMSLGVLLFWLSSSASLAQFDSGQIRKSSKKYSYAMQMPT